MTYSWINRLRMHRLEIEQHKTDDRNVFFRLALEYLKKGTAKVIDIGCGLSEFVNLAKEKNPEATIHLLDGNSYTLDILEKKGYNVIKYQVPEQLPFKDKEIDYINCSHLIEHLQPHDLYTLLLEFNRVICEDGIIVISTPSLWDGFYDDLSHVRPYPWQVLNKYLVSNDNGNLSYTRKHIGQFKCEHIFIRYEKNSTFNKLGLRSELLFVDLMILAFKKIAAKIGFYKLVITGYTAIYRKI